MNIKILVAAIFLNTVSFGLIAQDLTDTKQSFLAYLFVPDSTHLFRTKLAPILYFSPETSLGFGLAFIFNWDFKNVSSKTHSSNGRTTFIYTLNYQYDWTTFYEMFTNDNNFVFIGSVSFRRFPQYYYGIGDDLIKDDREMFDYQRVYIDLRNRYRIYRKFYLGLAYNFNTLYNITWKEGEFSKFWNNPDLQGTDGYSVSGLGPELTFDSRDNAANPLRGSYLNFAYLFYDQAFGSEYNYQLFEVDLSKYITINADKYWVLGINLVGKFTTGQTPFDRVPGLGSDEIMRGYYNGSLRDQKYMALQAEWRMPIWRFIGITAWIGTGQVGANLSDYTWQGLKPNFGVGLRLMYDKKSKSNVRLDQGFGESTDGFYFNIKEAF